MAEYIEREQTIKAVVSAVPKALGHGISAIAMVEIVDVIEELPTADVAEVKHAHWIPYIQPYGYGYSIPNYKPTHYCSNCRGLGWEFYTTCQNCGAKMDGKGDSE